MANQLNAELPPELPFEGEFPASRLKEHLLTAARHAMLSVLCVAKHLDPLQSACLCRFQVFSFVL
jgi:hypothetical protein